MLFIFFGHIKIILILRKLIINEKHSYYNRRLGFMVYVLVTIKVENYARWKATFDKKSVKREESGAKEARLFRNFENQNEIVILFEWDNLSNARKYMESDNIQKYLQDVAAEIVNISYLGEKETSI
jgi:hypothetical protein